MPRWPSGADSIDAGAVENFGAFSLILGTISGPRAAASVLQVFDSGALNGEDACLRESGENCGRFLESGVHVTGGRYRGSSGRSYVSAFQSHCIEWGGRASVKLALTSLQLSLTTVKSLLVTPCD